MLEPVLGANEMKYSEYARLRKILGSAYRLAAQGDSTLAEEVSGELAELIALMDGDMGAFGDEEVIDKELLSLASALIWSE
jgi:hypothetical protein